MMQRPALFLLGAIALACGGPNFSSGGDSPNGGTAGVAAVGSNTHGGSNSSGASATAGSSLSGSDRGGLGAGGADTATGGDPNSGGSSAAGTGAGGSGGMPDVMVCNPKATQCADRDFETCMNDGSGWVKEPCDFVCSTTQGCIGECAPGSNQCDGLNSQTCNVSGAWATTNTCAFICGGKGICTGQCAPGTEECSSSTRRHCKADGYWENVEACAFVCNFDGTSATCGGACTNNAKQCSGKVPQTCSNNAWSSGSACSYLCQNGACAGECVPGTSKCGPQGGIQTCSPQGAWLAEGSICPFTCSAGACTGVCVPNAGCGDDGNACTDDVCNSTGTACTHPDKTNGAGCGSSATSTCDAPDSCQSGTCQANPKPAGTACTSDSNTCTTDTCNGAGACTHPAAPANTVCRLAACAGGVTTSEAVCGGSTSCPASTTTECYGACNPQANACLNTAPTKIEDAYDMLASDNDAAAVYFSVRTQGGVSQILRFAKGTNTKTVLYEASDSSEYIRSMIVAGSYIYFGETFESGSITGQVSRIATTGANQVANYVSSDATFGFAKNSTHVFWSNARQNTCVCSNPAPTKVSRIAIPPLLPALPGNATPEALSLTFNGTELSPDLEVDDSGHLFVWMLSKTMNGPQVSQIYSPYLMQYDWATPLANPVEVMKAYFIENAVTYELTSNNTYMPGLTKQGSTVYGNVNLGMTSGGSLSPGAHNLIFKVSGGTTTRLTKTSTIGLTSTFVADATDVYTDTQKISVNGGSMSYWTNHQLGPALTLDAGFLYFGSWGYWTSLPYSGSPDVVSTSWFRVAK